MKQEILDRLLMDRALDGLSPDVSALLDAYVEKEPAQQALRESVDDCVRLAERAYPKPGAVELPPLKLVPMPASNPVWADRRAVLRVFEMAAAFALGIGLTLWGIHRGATTPKEPRENQLAHETRMPRSDGVGHEDGNAVGSGSQFWSLNRLSNSGASPEHNSPRRITWEIFMHNTQDIN